MYAKISEMTSRGTPFVSGTLRNTKAHEMMLTMANTQKAPARPIDFEIIGKESLTTTLLNHMVAEHKPMHTPLTLVGKISEQTIFGIGPNPVTNEHVKMARHTTESIAAPTPVGIIISVATKTINATTKIGNVTSNKYLM